MYNIILNQKSIMSSKEIKNDHAQRQPTIRRGGRREREKKRKTHVQGVKLTESNYITICFDPYHMMIWVKLSVEFEKYY